MANVNLVVLIGTLTRDPESRQTPNGKTVAGFGMAINHSYKTDSGEKREDATFVEVELWGRTAELVCEYVKKGDQLYVKGRLALDQWDDKTTGQKRSKMKVVGDEMQFMGAKKSASVAPPRNEPPSAPPIRKPVDPDLDAEDDSDIPF